MTSRLAALVRKELIRPDRPELAGEDAFRFRHLLIRDAAYDALPKATRADLHERFAAWLEEHARQVDRTRRDRSATTSSRATATAPSSAPPTTRPARSASARRNRLAAAGLRASDRGDLAAAANLLGRAVALLPAGEPRADRGRASPRRASGRLMRVAEIETLLDEAGAAAEILGDERLAARVTWRRRGSTSTPRTSSVSESAVLAQVEQAMAVFERLGDDAGLARALEVVTNVHLYFGRLAEVAAASERGYHHAERAQQREAAGEASARPEAADAVGHDAARPGRTSCSRRTSPGRGGPGASGSRRCATVRLGVVRGAARRSGRTGTSSSTAGCPPASSSARGSGPTRSAAARSGR